MSTDKPNPENRSIPSIRVERLARILRVTFDSPASRNAI
jgi:hypothetical protein